MKDKLKYEQPELIRLNSSMTTMGANCLGGSSATTGCVTGPTAALGCKTGSSGPPPPPCMSGGAATGCSTGTIP